MAKEIIEVLVEGGKATAAPPLGPALGPMGVNIGQVVGEINNKTKAFSDNIMNEFKEKLCSAI